MLCCVVGIDDEDDANDDGKDVDDDDGPGRMDRVELGDLTTNPVFGE